MYSGVILSEFVCLAALCVLCVIAALSDARHYKIPNRVVIAIAALYPAFAISTTAQINLLSSLALGLVCLAVGFLLYKRRFLGAGDAKLLAALALWAGSSFLLPFLLLVGTMGGLLALLAGLSALIDSKSLVGPQGHFTLGSITHKAIPYGTAIGMGGIWIACQYLSVGIV